MLSQQNTPSQPLPRSVLANPKSNENQKSEIYTFYLKNNYIDTGEVKNMLVINISASWLNDAIDYIEPQTETDKKTFIIDKNGSVVFSTDENTKNEYDREYLKEVVSQNEPVGYFIANNDEEIEIFTVYVWSSYFDWCFVSTIPYSSMISDILTQQRITISVSLVIFAISIFFIFLLSRKISLPVKKAYEKILSIEEERDSELKEIKSTVLLSLLNGRLNKNNYFLVERYQSEGNTTVDLHSCMIVFILLIDHYDEFCKSAMFLEKENICKQLKEIAADIVKPLDAVDVINGYDNKIIMLGNYGFENASSKAIQDEFLPCLHEFQNKVAQEVKIDLTIAVSDVAHNFRDLPICYDDASNLCMYRFTLGHRSILFSYDLNQYEGNEIDYGMLAVKPLIEAIGSGNIDTAKKEYTDIISSLGIVPMEIFKHLLNQLYFEIRLAFKAKISSRQALDGQLTDFFARLQAVETLSDAEMLFHKLFGSVCLYLEEMQNSKYNELVEKTMHYIDENYHLNSLSASLIADEINISAAYLGKLFKQYANTSIPKYISDVRLKKSQEMLLKTEMSVNEIAEAAGFTNSSYFYSVFKRETGVTPNQYRTNEELTKDSEKG